MKSFGYLLKEGFKNLWCNRTMTIASIAVLVSCLLLTGSAILGSMNISSAVGVVQSKNSIMVYLSPDIPSLQSVQIGQKISSIDNIDTSVFISKDDAIQKYAASIGASGDILNGLTGSNNPLPDAYAVSMKDLSKYDATVTQLKQLAGVQNIRDGSYVAGKLTSISNAVKWVGLAIVIVLGVVSLFIIANTIRITMHSRRLEISIMKSVGATNWFVRLPFLVEGAIIGLVSGVIATGLVALVYNMVTDAIKGVLGSFNPIPMSTVMLWVSLIFVGAGILFGLIGSFISISKYLNKEGRKVMSIQ